MSNRRLCVALILTLLTVAFYQNCASKFVPKQQDVTNASESPTEFNPMDKKCKDRSLKGRLPLVAAYENFVIPPGRTESGLIPNLQSPDFNGDGKFDFVFRRIDNTFMVSLAGSGGNSPFANWQQVDGPHKFGQETYLDFTGDGNDDLIFQTIDNRFLVSISNGAGFTGSSEWVRHSGSFVQGQAGYADLNGDCKTDLIFHDDQNRFWVSLSNGDSFTSPSVWVQHGDPAFVLGQSQYADLNGDGKADLIYQSSSNKFWVSISTGTSFLAPQLWIERTDPFVWGQAQYADANGDGKADLLFQTTDNKFEVGISDGTKFSEPELWMQHGGIFVVGQAQYPDLNGDGKADLVLQGADSRFWVSPSNGNQFEPPQMWISHADAFTLGQVRYSDVDDDGKADLIFNTFDYKFLTAHSLGTSFAAFQMSVDGLADLTSPLPPRTANPNLKFYGYYTNSQQVRDSIEFRDHANAGWASHDTWKSLPSVSLSGMKVIVGFGPLIFDRTYPNGQILFPDWRSRLTQLANNIAPYADRIAFFYLSDELIHDYNLIQQAGPRGTAINALEQTSAFIKTLFPNIPVGIVESCDSVLGGNDYPATIDWIGYDCYSVSPADYAAITQNVKPLLKPNQRILFIPKGGHLNFQNPTLPPVAQDQVDLIGVINGYADAALDPENEPWVVGFLPYEAHNNSYGIVAPPLWGGMEDVWGVLDNTPVKQAFIAVGKRLLFGQ